MFYPTLQFIEFTYYKVDVFLIRRAVCVGGLGTWSSSSAGVLQVDARSGAAVARDSGTATVYYEIPGVLKTYREVCHTCFCPMRLHDVTADDGQA